MLLDDIIEIATNNDQSITVLLRKCLVLAHQIKNERLKVWAGKELNGYKDDDQLPDYRVIPAESKGHFVGFGGSQLNHYRIPSAVLEERHRRFATTVNLMQAIAAYESLVTSGKPGGTITTDWPHNLVLYYQDRIPFTQRAALVSAYQEIQKPTLVELIDTIRNRILNVALEIQAEVGRTDDDLRKITRHAEEKIERYVNQQIFHGTVYMAADNANMSFQQQNITVGGWKQLEQVLRNSGVTDDEVMELSAAVSNDGNEMGSSVKGWIQKTAPKVLSGGGKMAQEVGQAILTDLLKKHFGLS